MSLTGWPFLACIALLVIVPCGLAIAKPSWILSLRRGYLAGLAIAGQLSAVLLVALVANDGLGFYPSWTDLVGQKVSFHAEPVSAATATLEQSAQRALGHAPRGHGAQLSVQLGVGAASSGVRVVVYLPAAYRGPNDQLRFPVVELIGASITGPAERRLVQTIDQEIASARIPPVVVVIVPATETQIDPTNPSPRPATAGPIVPTSVFGSEVRNQLAIQLRIRTDRNGWALLAVGSGTRYARTLVEQFSGIYETSTSARGLTDLKLGLDLVGAGLSPPLAPPITNAAKVTSRREDLRG